MDGKLVPFDFKGQSVRSGVTDGQPWFVAQDVADILGIQNIRQNLAGFPSDEKGVCTVSTNGGKQTVAVVYEPGLYRMIFTSRKAEAEAFKHWVCHEVLPSIRKTGKYETRKAAKYAKITNDPAWVEQREKGIGYRKDLTDTLQNHGVEKPAEYGACTNAIYQGVLGGTAAEAKKERKLPVKANLRDNLTRKELAVVALSEMVAQDRIEEENRIGFEPCRSACQDAGAAIAAACNVKRQIA